MENVRDVAKWFLSQDSMTHKKLQKLCYYAQAWHCALYGGTPLFEDEIQAWVHGPVVTSLYPVYADYGWSSIPQVEFDDNHMDDAALDVLEAVYNTYGGFTGDQLESLTHSEAPWIDARNGVSAWTPCSTPISCAAMREYYGRKYQEAQGE